MTRLSAASVAAAILLADPATMASEPQPLISATAAWADEGDVQLDVAWQGGACEAPGEPEVIAGDLATNEVTIPTVSTAEICTMQIVEVTYSGTIPVEPRTTSLAITVLDPEGRPQAAGTVEIGMPSKAAADEGH